MSFVGGKLKLKGGETLKPAGGVKKKKKSKDKDKEEGGSSSAALALADNQTEEQAGAGASGAGASGSQEQDIKRIVRGYELKEPEEHEDRRTEAEKRFEQHQIKLEQERLKKLAGKSHRDRIKDFNDYLANLSEHHDIPRVGPG